MTHHLNHFQVSGITGIFGHRHNILCRDFWFWRLCCGRSRLQQDKVWSYKLDCLASNTNISCLSLVLECIIWETGPLAVTWWQLLKPFLRIKREKSEILMEKLYYTSKAFKRQPQHCGNNQCHFTCDRTKNPTAASSTWKNHRRRSNK